MMVADDEVNAEAFGMSYLLVCLYSAIKDNDEFNTCLLGVFNPFIAYSISFVVTVGDVIVNVRIKLLQNL